MSFFVKRGLLMKILSIGNSFSVDSQTWARKAAAAGGETFELGNLYIGGCSLERHMENVRSGEAAYDYFVNNENIGRASVRTALMDEKWDFVTVQQASHFSGKPETYFPFIEELADYARALAPSAEIVVNETWAYEFDSTHPAFENYGRNRFQMHACLSEAYRKGAKAIGARMISVGEAVRIARENAAFDPERGGVPLTRDGFHLSLYAGRLLAGLTWYEFFTGRDARENRFVPALYEYTGKNPATGERTFVPVPSTMPTQEQLAILRNAAHAAVTENR